MPNIPELISKMATGNGVFKGDAVFALADGSFVDKDGKEVAAASPIAASAYSSFEGFAVPSEVTAEATALSAAAASGAISTHNTDAGAHTFLLNRVNALQSAITVANLLPDGNFESPMSWAFTLANGTVINNVATFTPTANLGQLNSVQSLPVVAGKTYYYRADVKTLSHNAKLYIARASDGNNLSPISAVHSGSGDWMVLEGTFVAPESTNVKFRVYNAAISGFVQIEVKEAMLTCLTDEFGVGNEPSLNAYKGYIYTYNNGSYFINTTLGIYVDIDTSYYPPLYVNIANSVANIISKYDDQYDARMVLNKKGPNLIFDISYIYKISNISKNVSSDITAGTVFFTNTTDTFGPYVIAAVNNINGDNPSVSGFTGGNHGYNGDATGSATGRTTNVVFFVDGRKVTSYAGYASKVDIEWTNYVQAYNTKVVAGTGREVLKETYRLHYDGSDWSIHNTIELLEECSISVYYGAQLSVPAWAGYTLFQSAVNNTRYAGNITCDAGDKKCDIITHNTGADFAEIELDLGHGLGSGTYLTGTKNAFRTDYNKSYFYLVDSSATFASGSVLTWRCKYRFYSA